mmetsp:Transcript_22974/g.58752  ORF Transcript_22974/g.58752 Transcript_22974/m.58752 type:complete len:295 (+) Transcript_22974:743-1627(+)
MTLLNASTRLPLEAPVCGQSLNCHLAPCTMTATTRAQSGEPAGGALSVIWYGTPLEPGGLPMVRVIVALVSFCTPRACTTALGSKRPSSRKVRALYMVIMAVMPLGTMMMGTPPLGLASLPGVPDPGLPGCEDGWLGGRCDDDGLCASLPWCGLWCGCGADGLGWEGGGAGAGAGLSEAGGWGASAPAAPYMLMADASAAAPAPPMALSASVVVSRSKRPEGFAATTAGRGACSFFSACSFCLAATSLALAACASFCLMRADSWKHALLAMSSTRLKSLLGATSMLLRSRSCIS